jgi:cytochrome c biogenesis protein CcmG/thiol:disulfide interchange protein DsbE
MSDKLDDQGSRPDRNQTSDFRPLYIFLGFLLLGASLALVLFGGNLLNSSTSKSDEASSQTLLDQVSDLSEIGIGADGSNDSSGFIDVGDEAPNYTLLDLDGRNISLADFRGQPVIMNLWATWCAPCRIEMPALQEAIERHQEQGLVILALNQGETADVARQYFYDEMGLTFTPLLDENSSVAATYSGMNVLPTTYFIDQEGIVSAIHRGPLTTGQIEGYLAEIIDSNS